MDRDSMNDRASAALGLQTRELTKAELDAVSGGFIVSVEQPNAISSATGGAGAGKSTGLVPAVQ